jgi:Fe-S cluster biogenesis protein NfuA
MQEPTLHVFPEDTPNPLSNKFSVNRKLLDGAGRDFPYAEASRGSPLAAELFLLSGVSAVYIGADFVTVTIKPGIDWWSQRPLIVQTIESHLAAGKPVLGEDPSAGEIPADKKALTPLELGVIRVLESEIQPAVAMDGGYIAFAGFDEGVVKVHLRGACHSCPSALVTLKAGIEARLKQEFPEIVRVEPV